MSREAPSWGGLALLLAAIATGLVACSTPAPTNNGPGGSVTDGSLTVTVGNIATRHSATVTVNGASYTKTLTATTTLTGLAPGIYSVSATPPSINVRRNTLDLSVSPGTVDVVAGATAKVGVSYVPEQGDLWVGDTLSTTSSASAIDGFPAITLGTTNTPSETITNGVGHPSALAFDAGGNLWVANYWGNSVAEFAKGDLITGAAPLKTVYFGATAPSGLAFDAGGNLWASFGNAREVRMYASADLVDKTTASPTVTFSGLAYPAGLAFDADGNLWVAREGASLVMYAAGDLGNSAASPSKTLTHGTAYAVTLAFDAAGDLWVGRYNASSVIMFSHQALTTVFDPQPTTTITTGAPDPVGVAIDVFGNLWVTHDRGGALEEFAAGDIGQSGTPTALATIGGFTDAQATAFDPPPYNLPLSH